MEIPISEMESGYTVAFKGNGFLFRVLSFILDVIEPKWRKRKWKPWHLAIASKKIKAGTRLSTGEKTIEDGWLLIEAIAPVTGEYFHSMRELEEKTRAYEWLDKPPSPLRVKQFKNIYLGFPYGVLSYVGVVLSYTCRKLFRIRWRIMDTEHMCWEVNSFFHRFMGKPYQRLWEYPMIHDIIERLESEHVAGGSK